MINKWISKRSRDVAGKFEIHRNQGDITEKRNEQKIQIMYKPEISREIHYLTEHLVHVPGVPSESFVF